MLNPYQTEEEEPTNILQSMFISFFQQFAEAERTCFVELSIVSGMSKVTGGIRISSYFFLIGKFGKNQQC